MQRNHGINRADIESIPTPTAFKFCSKPKHQAAGNAVLKRSASINILIRNDLKKC
jgi:hypothetical protein